MQTDGRVEAYSLVSRTRPKSIETFFLTIWLLVVTESFKGNILRD